MHRTAPKQNTKMMVFGS